MSISTRHVESKQLPDMSYYLNNLYGTTTRKVNSHRYIHTHFSCYRKSLSFAVELWISHKIKPNSRPDYCGLCLCLNVPLWLPSSCFSFSVSLLSSRLFSWTSSFTQTRVRLGLSPAAPDHTKTITDTIITSLPPDLTHYNQSPTRSRLTNLC